VDERDLEYDLDDVWDVDSEDDDFERDTPRSQRERDEFGQRPTRDATERLAVYLPFHFYPAGHWGVRFFERPMVRFTDRLDIACRRRGLRYPWIHLLKMATYAIARHEFVHYLTELEALDGELKGGRRIYRPYWDGVYKRSYPGSDCLEETVANTWAWDNGVVTYRAAFRDVFRSVLKAGVSDCYRNGVSLDRTSVRATEDRLIAQLLTLRKSPVNAPPVWGVLPRPYVQPWTRYENVSFAMNRSAGGSLGRILRARPLRRTIRIYHR
jgi:hypothetical protein